MSADSEKPASPAPAPNQPTPIFYIAFAIAVIAYIVLVFGAEMPDDPGFIGRVFTGYMCGVVAFGVWIGALKATAFFMKALVEITGVLLLLGDGAAVVLGWKFVHEVADSSDDVLPMAILLAIGLFMLNVCAFVVLYPLSRSVGTSLEEGIRKME